MELMPANAERFKTLGIIIADNRTRKLNPAKVKEIAQSMQDNGQITPISVGKITTNDNGMKLTLIAGLHRIRAAEKIWEGGNPEFQLLIAAEIVAPKDYITMELAENLHRNDLNREERKKLAAVYGQEMVKRESITVIDGSPPTVNDGSPTNPKGGGRKPSWFSSWYNATKIDEPTARRYWKNYSKAVGIEGPAAKHEDHKEAFFAWLADNSDEAIAKGKEKADEELAKRVARIEQGIIDAIEEGGNLVTFSPGFKKRVDQAMKEASK